jgi:hypothetical protein
MTVAHLSKDRLLYHECRERVDTLSFMTTFTFLNMFVAIFTNTVVALEADSEEGSNTEMRRINQNITELSNQIELLRKELSESE